MWGVQMASQICPLRDRFTRLSLDVEQILVFGLAQVDYFGYSNRQQSLLSHERNRHIPNRRNSRQMRQPVL